MNEINEIDDLKACLNALAQIIRKMDHSDLSLRHYEWLDLMTEDRFHECAQLLKRWNSS